MARQCGSDCPGVSESESGDSSETARWLTQAVTRQSLVGGRKYGIPGPRPADVESMGFRPADWRQQSVTVSVCPSQAAESDGRGLTPRD